MGEVTLFLIIKSFCRKQMKVQPMKFFFLGVLSDYRVSTWLLCLLIQFKLTIGL